MRRLLVVLMALSMTVSAGAVGSGSYTNQTVVGTKALGMGMTFAAVADDPSAVYFNPAGLSRQKSFAVMAGLVPVFSGADYTPDAGAASDMKSDTSVVPYLYLSAPLSDRWTLGFGVNSPFGLATHWDQEGPLRYTATDSTLVYVGFNPTVAYKVNDRFSVGAGVSYARVSAKLDSRLDLTGLNTVLNGMVYTPSPDGKKSLKGDGGGWGWNVGALFSPLEGHSIGLAYRSAIKPTLKGETRMSDLSDASAALFGGSSYSVDAETRLEFPDSLFLGYAFERGPWTWALDAEWAGYSVAQETRLIFKEADATRSAILNDGNPIAREWKDAWNIGGGVDYKVNDRYAVRGGLYYIPTVIPEKTWEPSTPEALVVGYTLGAGYSQGPLTVDVGYNLLQFKRKTVHNTVGNSMGTTVDGKYTISAQVVSLGVTWRFAR